MMCFGLFFTFSALMVTGGKSKQAGEEEQASQIAAAIEDENEGKQPLLEVEEMNGEKKSTKDMHVYPITTGTIVFQALLTAAAIYYAMLLTNWGNPVFLNSSYNFFTQSSKTSYWC
jgi:pheromone shutdown protein TraB